MREGEREGERGEGREGGGRERMGGRERDRRRKLMKGVCERRKFNEVGKQHWNTIRAPHLLPPTTNS